MSNPRDFFNAVGPIVVAISNRLGAHVFPETLMAQFADETHFDETGTHPKGHNNLAGISPGGQIADFVSLAAFADSYVSTISQNDYGFPAVLEADAITLQMIRLGQSEWAGSHYDTNKSGRPGCDLIAVYMNFKTDIEDAISRAKGIVLLNIGSTGPDVIQLQTELNKVDNSGLVVDGDFGEKTHTAVVEFQKLHGLQVDGIVGPETRNTLKIAYDELENKVQAVTPAAPAAPATPAAPTAPAAPAAPAAPVAPATMEFGKALDSLNAGKKIARSGWNGKNQWVAKQVPDANSKMRLPYAYLSNVSGELVPWIPSQGDLFATDWVEVQ